MSLSKSQGSVMVLGGNADTSANPATIEAQLDRDAHEFFRHTHNEGSIGEDIRGSDHASLEHDVIVGDGGQHSRTAGITGPQHPNTDLGTILGGEDSDPIDMTRVDFEPTATAAAALEAAKKAHTPGVEAPASAQQTSKDVPAPPSLASHSSEKGTSAEANGHSGAASTTSTGDSSGTDLDNFSPMHMDDASHDLDASLDMPPLNTKELSLKTSDLEGHINICLCQQPARIPRPRNAFILFRQHKHATVVAENPKKPNPEISKIIGNMWKESPQEVRDVWQRLAEEEKKQHLQRYPEYRYQPRRSGKKTPGLGAGGLPSGEMAFCQTCGGKTGALSVPSTPATPATPATPLSQPISLSKPPVKVVPPKLQALAGKKKRIDEHDSQAGVEALLQLGLQNDFEDDRENSENSPPNSKKRKLNNGNQQSHLMTPTSAVLAETSPDTNIDPSLRIINALLSKDESNLRKDMPPPSATASPLSTRRFDYVPSHLAIPPLTKLKGIMKVAKPLSTFASREFHRGAVVAIEGEDRSVVSNLVISLKENMTSTTGDNTVVVSPDDFCDDGSILVPDADLDEGRLMAKYLRSVADWRAKTRDLTRLVCGYVEKDGDMRMSSIDSLMSVLGSSPPPQSQQQGSTVQNMSPPASSVSPSSANFNPQNVLINRYIYSRANQAANRLASSSEGFTPVEHWQWTASIWRGCVGPDVTILVKEDKNALSGSVDSLAEGVIVATVGKNGWEGATIRRLAFEVGEFVRALRGLET